MPFNKIKNSMFLDRCRLFSVPHVKQVLYSFYYKVYTAVKVYATCYKFSCEDEWCTEMYLINTCM